MSPTKIAQFSQKAVADRCASLGVTVVFRGQEMKVCLSPSQPELSLVSGGLRTTAAWRICVPATVQPPPGYLGAQSEDEIVNEVFQELGTERKFYVTSCIPAALDSPNAQEHIVEVRLA